ncbi:hypothetical protein [Actinocrispum sp. NPDC049592]|uniref:hypothetical protein n=1 Tax=Actinocrispum sp. NPDC049592 TaxID=3154835 RepID=UPI003429E09F
MFEYYESPEAQRVRIRFEEIAAVYRADHERALAADEQRGKEMREQQEKDARAEELTQQAAAARKARTQPAADPDSPWTAPREVSTVMSFGEFEDEERPSSTWSSPTPPMGFPPPPPIPDPIPEPEHFRGTSEQPVMSFGFEDDEAETPPPPVHQEQPQAPRPGRRRRQEDDDEDMSSQSWLS